VALLLGDRTSDRVGEPRVHGISAADGTSQILLDDDDDRSGRNLGWRAISAEVGA
jgi:hypothetical protein